MNMTLRQACKYPAFASVFLAAIGTAAFGRDFVKLRIAPLYALEFLFLVWTIFAVFTISRNDGFVALKQLRAPIAFFLWGIALLLGDLIFGHFAAGSSRQTVQHCILFVYPILWSCIGYWLQTTDPRFPRWILYCVLVASSLSNLLSKEIVNLSVGPLLIIPVVILMAQAMREQEFRRTWFKNAVYSLILACLTFMPFWAMWNIHMQRTSLLLLTGMIIGLPFCLISRKPKYVFGLLTSSFLFTFLLAGFVIPSFPSLRPRKAVAPVEVIQSISPQSGYHLMVPRQSSNASSVRINAHPPLSAHFEHKAIAILQHGDDVPIQGKSHHFQMRTRRFMWKTAISQWLTHPIIGIGFVPEVPCFVEPNQPNTGGFEAAGTPPVSGPHNSYLSILARMGLIGMSLFLFIAQQWFYRARILFQAPLVLSDLLLIAIPINGAIYALFNVGFESPHNCMLLWLAVGIMLARTEFKPDENPLHP